jgi:phage-related minor tail protein
MDEELERLVISVRADVGGFSRDVAAMRGQLDGPLSEGAAQAGDVIDRALSRAIRSGKLGFDDLRRTALTVLGEIASATVRNGVGSLLGGGGGGLAGTIGSLLPKVLGFPGRATGGPVTGGRAYVVGERGPELFVPTASGKVVAAGGGRGAVSVTVNVSAPREAGSAGMQRTGAQVARAVRRALADAEG